LLEYLRRRGQPEPDRHQSQSIGRPPGQRPL